MYIHQTNDVIDSKPTARNGLTHKSTSISAATTDAELKNLGWLPLIDPDDAYDPATQIRTGPVGGNIGDPVPADADDVTGTYTVRDKTAQELDDDQREQDIATLRSAGKDMALVLTELIEWTLANTAMQPTDFTPDVKQAYLGLKAIADRVK